VKYYLAIKKNEMMSFSGNWIEMKIMMLSEISQMQKDKYHVFLLICGFQNKNQTTQKT
jgi:hypothetical protein